MFYQKSIVRFFFLAILWTLSIFIPGALFYRYVSAYYKKEKKISFDIAYITTVLVFGILIQNLMFFILFYIFKGKYKKELSLTTYLILIPIWLKKYIQKKPKPYWQGFREPWKDLLDNININTTFFILVESIFFLYFWQTYLVIDSNKILFSHAGWGDGPRHWGIAMTILSGNFPPVEPLFPSVKLFYHYFSDFHLAILYNISEALGLSTKSPFFTIIYGHIYTELLIILLIMLAVYLISSKLIKSNILSLSAVLLFLFGSGYTYYNFLYNLFDVLTSEDFTINTIKKTCFRENPGFRFSYTLFPMEKFSSIILFIFPERSTLYGILFFVFTIDVITNISRSQIVKNRSIPPITKEDLRVFICEFLIGFICGASALFHIHNIIIAAITMTYILYLKIYERSQDTIKILYLLAFVIGFSIIPFFQVYLIGYNKIESGLTYNLYWYATDIWKALSFYTYNFGAIFFTGILFSILMPEKLFSIIFFVSFGALNTLQIGKSIWDNHHLIPFIWLSLVLPTVWGFKYIYINRTKSIALRYIIIILFAFLFVAAIAGGSLELIYQWIQVFPLLTLEDYRACEYIYYNTPENSIFISPGHHNDCITYIGGRLILKGFDTWLWSYGIDFTAQKNDVHEFYTSNCQKKRIIADKYKIDFILYPSFYNISKIESCSEFREIYRNNRVILYKKKKK